MSEGEQPSVVRLDAKKLRALAHPLRVRLLGALRLDGPSTATALARRFGENSANTSWHLRQLAAAALVTEDTTRGNRRERWWAAAHDTTAFDQAEHADDPELAGPLATYLHAVNTVHHDQVGTYLATMGELPPQWRAAADLSDIRLWLSSDEATELGEQIHQLVERFRRPRRDEDTEVITHWHLLPRPPREP
jgi:hypothetical protein